MTYPDDDFGTRNYENVINSILSQSYEIYEDFDEERPVDVVFHGDESVDLPLFEEEDILILMHRDAHFSGSFSAMKEYYKDLDSKGIIEEIDPERIELLETIQQRMKIDLAPLLISGPDAEKVALSRKMYRELGEVIQKAPSSPEGIIASAILSEQEVDDLIANLSSTPLVRPESLVLLATSDLFCDPLFPGYGTASRMAIGVLGKKRHEPAIQELFRLIGRRDFLTETAALEALRKIGPRAKKIAMDRLASFPFTDDHERAVLVLIEFLPDEEISKLFSKILSDERMKNARLRTYLALGLDSSSESSCSK